MIWTVYLDGGPRRVNHAAVTVDDKIYSFGGYCTGENYSQFLNIDVYVLHTVALRWKSIKQDPCPDAPFQRYGHTVVAYDHIIYLWGGRNDMAACNKLFTYDTRTHTWAAPAISGQIPDARDGHSACIVDDIMYIFAGYIETSEAYTQEIHALDLKTLTWSYVCAEGPKPIYRDFHTASALDGLMYVWGGREVACGWYESVEQEQYGSQMHMFDPVKKRWSMIPSFGTTPVGRRSHSAVVYKNDLYIFGGFNSQKKEHYNDLYKFELDTCTWSKLAPLGTPPCPRRRQAFCLSGTKIYLFGGTSPMNLPIATASNKLLPAVIPDDLDEEENLNIDQQLVTFDPDEQLIDHGDLHVLDLEPTLKTLTMVEVLKLNLDVSILPLNIKMCLKLMTMPNSISSRTRNHTG